MTSELPPDPPYFSGIDFNPSFYVDESNSSGITQEQAFTKKRYQIRLRH